MIGVTEVENLSRAGLDAGGLHADFGAVRTEITLVSDVVVVATDGGVGASGFAFARVFAEIRIDAYNAAGIVINGVIRAGFETGRVFALHAEGGQEVARDFGVRAVLLVINLGAIAAERDVVFDFAGHRAGVAANAALNVKRKFPAGVGGSRRGH